MAKVQPASVEAYLASLPEDRRHAIQAVRSVILKNLDKDYEEVIQYGAIGYCVPHRVYPAGYHCDPRQPLPYVGIASQKNHMAVYLFCTYCTPGGERTFRDAWAKTGKKLDMGKSCVRFKKLEDVALDVIGDTIKRTPVKVFIQSYESSLNLHAAAGTEARTAKPAKGSSKKKVAKKAAKKVVKKAAPKARK